MTTPQSRLLAIIAEETCLNPGLLDIGQEDTLACCLASQRRADGGVRISSVPAIVSNWANSLPPVEFLKEKEKREGVEGQKRNELSTKEDTFTSFYLRTSNKQSTIVS